MTSLALMWFLLAVPSPQESPAPLPLSLAHELAEPPAAAEEFPRWKVGVRFEAWTGFGVPANDLMGGSIYGSTNLKNLVHEDWWFTLQVFNFNGFDFERPDEALFDIKAPPTVDAVLDMQIIRFTAEWHPVARGSIVDPYIGAGFGIVFTGDGDAKDLPTSDIELKGGVGVELHVVAGAALRVVGPVYLTVEFSATWFFAGWDATDRVSGRKESLEKWNAAGVGVGLEVRF